MPKGRLSVAANRVASRLRASLVVASNAPRMHASLGGTGRRRRERERAASTTLPSLRERSVCARTGWDGLRHPPGEPRSRPMDARETRCTEDDGGRRPYAARRSRRATFARAAGTTARSGVCRCMLAPCRPCSRRRCSSSCTTRSTSTPATMPPRHAPCRLTLTLPLPLPLPLPLSLSLRLSLTLA